MTTRVGSATGTNTATMPTHAVGDLIVAFAFRDGSTTAPSIPSEGWTSLGASSSAIGQAGTTCSAVMVVKRADSTSEAVGTFTNATFVGVVVYRGGTGKQVGIGTWTFQAGTASTVTYPATTLIGASSTSWTGAFAGHRSVDTSLQTAPTNMSNVATFVDATDEGAIHDTNGPVASWASTGVAVGGTASGWITAVFEVREFTTVLTRFKAERDHPTNNALVIGIGHSFMAGARAAPSDADSIKFGYLQTVADNFTACHAASSDSSFMGDQNITANGISPAVFNANLTLGTFAAYASDSIPGARAFTPGSAGTLSWDPDVAFDRLQVFYIRYSGSPEYTVNVDGGASLGTLNMNDTPSLFATETFSVTDTTHQVRFVAAAINGFIAGAIVWRSTVKQLTFLNAAWASGLTTDFLVSTQPYNPLPALRTFGNVAATIIQLDANEILNSISLTAFRFNLAVLTLERLFYGDVVLISSAYMNPTLGFSEATQLTYHNVVAEWADVMGCAYVRGTAQPGLSTYAAGDALGYYDADDIHMTEAGYTVSAATPLLALLDVQTLSPGLLTNTSTFYAPTVSQGGGTQTLTPGLLTNTSSFYAPTVSPGSVALSPGLFTNTSSFYAPTITTGSVTLSPGLLSNTNTFYGPTVTQPGGGTLWTPTELGSAVAGWWDAADAATITLNSGNVSAWANKGAAGGSLAQASGGAQPPYSATALNGLPGVTGAAGTHSMATGTLTGLPTGTDPAFTMFAVGKPDAASASLGAFVTFGANASEAMPMLGTLANGNFYIDCFGSGITTSVNVTGSGHILSVKHNTDTTTYSHVDGVASGQSSFSVAPGASPAAKIFDWFASGYPNGGILQEYIILSTVLSDADREILEGYAAWKWGLEGNLDAGHPYKSAAPTVASGSQSLTPGLLTNTNTFYAATVTTGAVTLTPGLLTNSNTFHAPTVSQSGGPQTLTPGLLTNSSTFHAPTVTPGAATLSPGLLTNVSEFYGATISQPSLQTLSPGLLTNVSVFYPPAANQNDPPGTYPLAIEGGGTVVIEMIDGVPTVVGGTINFTGSVVAGALRGRP